MRNLIFGDVFSFLPTPQLKYLYLIITQFSHCVFCRWGVPDHKDYIHCTLPSLRSQKCQSRKKNYLNHKIIPPGSTNFLGRRTFLCANSLFFFQKIAVSSWKTMSKQKKVMTCHYLMKDFSKTKNITYLIFLYLYIINEVTI